MSLVGGGGTLKSFPIQVIYTQHMEIRPRYKAEVISIIYKFI